MISAASGQSAAAMPNLLVTSCFLKMTLPLGSVIENVTAWPATGLTSGRGRAGGVVLQAHAQGARPAGEQAVLTENLQVGRARGQVGVMQVEHTQHQHRQSERHADAENQPAAQTGPAALVAVDALQRGR